MAAIMPDHNVEGHFGVMLRILADDPWRVLWAEMGFEIASFETLGLMLNVSDTDLWQTCQRRDVVLITANRNDDGPDSLEATIQRLNRPSHLPILTISDAEQVLSNRDYATRIVARLLEYLLDLDNYRRTGRLYLS